MLPPPITSYAVCKAVHWKYDCSLCTNIDMRTDIIARLRTKDSIQGCGDGQFDSLGHCGKYCTYSFMLCGDSLFVDFYVNSGCGLKVVVGKPGRKLHFINILFNV